MINRVHSLLIIYSGMDNGNITAIEQFLGTACTQNLNPSIFNSKGTMSPK